MSYYGRVSTLCSAGHLRTLEFTSWDEEREPRPCPCGTTEVAWRYSEDITNGSPTRFPLELVSGIAGEATATYRIPSKEETQRHEALQLAEVNEWLRAEFGEDAE